MKTEQQIKREIKDIEKLIEKNRIHGFNLGYREALKWVLE